MTTASMPWIKLYTEMLDDPKIGRLSDAMKWRFVQLVLLAGECDSEGCIANGDVVLTVEEVAWRLRLDHTQLAADIEQLKKIGLVSDDDKTLCVINFTKRQGRPQSERQRRWRENQKNKRTADKEAASDDQTEGDPVSSDDKKPADKVSSDDKKSVIDDTTMTQRPREEKRREEKSAASPLRIPAPKKEKTPRPRDVFFDCLTEITHSNPAIVGNEIASAKKKLLEGGVTIEDLRHFETWWNQEDFRGKKGNPPKPWEITREWATFQKWKAGTVAPILDASPPAYEWRPLVNGAALNVDGQSYIGEAAKEKCVELGIEWRER